jgi:peroxiredoxin
MYGEQLVIATQEREQPQVGAEAPDFELTTLAGDTLKLSELRGKVVWLSFGATWCPDCHRETPVLQGAHEAYGEDLVVLAVDMREEAATVQGYVDRNQVTYTIVLDPDGAVTERYRVQFIPTSFFIDVDGIIRAAHIDAISAETLVKTLGEMGFDLTPSP